MKNRCLFLLVLCVCAFALFSEEEPSKSLSLALGRVLYSEEDSVLKEEVEALIASAIEETNSTHIKNSYKISLQNTHAQFLVNVIVQETKKEPIVLSLEDTSSEDTIESVMITWSSKEEMQNTIAAVLYSFLKRISTIPKQEKDKLSCDLVYELDFESIAEIFQSEYPQSFYPLSIATNSDGGIVLPLYDGIHIFSPWFQSVEDIAMEGSLKNVYPYKSAYSEGGTLIIVGSTGDIYKIPKGQNLVEKTKGQTSYLNSNILSNGALLVQDYNTNMYQYVLGKKAKAFSLGTREPTYADVGPFASDAEGRIYKLYLTNSIVAIYSQSGVFLKSVRLTVAGEPLRATGLCITNNGSIIAYNTDGLFVFDQNGELLLKKKDFNSLYMDVTGFQVFQLCYSELNNIIYVMNQNLRIIQAYKLTDLDNPNSKVQNILVENAYRQLVNINKNTGLAFTDKALERRKVFNELNAFDLVYVENKFLNEESNENVKDFLLAYKEGIQYKALEKKCTKVLTLLRTLGPESARAEYSIALKAFEAYVALYDASKVKTLRENLISEFKKKENDNVSNIYSLKVSEIKLESLYPAFFEAEQGSRLGFCTIENQGKENISVEKVSLYIKSFMDFPLDQTEAFVLKAGEKKQLTLSVKLNRSVLKLQEDISVLAELSIVSKDSYSVNEMNKSLTVAINKKNAINWKDSKAIGAFVTQNDDTIVSFAHNALRLESILTSTEIVLNNKNLTKAMLLVSALSSLGFVYIEDPETPFKKSVANLQLVDTVRFPRTSLENRAGDCDDTTALLLSLFASCGLESAIITTEGHIFTAFCVDDNIRNAYLYSHASFGVIQYNKKLYIPIETTVFSLGFVEAWKKGYEQLELSKNNYEFILLSKAQEVYPSLPLEENILQKELFDIKTSLIKVESAHNELINLLYKPIAAALLQEKVQVQVFSKLAALSYFFGKYDLSKNYLKQLLELDNANKNALYNLYNLEKLSGTEESLKALKNELVKKYPSNSEIVKIFLQVNSNTLNQSVSVSKSSKESETRGAEIKDDFTFVWE